MRDSRRLGLDTEMFVPVTIAEPAGLNGEDTVKTADYSPLELIFKKMGFIPWLFAPSVFLCCFPASFLLGMGFQTNYLGQTKASSEQESPEPDPVLRFGCTRSGWKVSIFVSAVVNLSAIF